jgi:hypothetical protein
MDLNELLHAHQIEVMKAASCVDDNHFGMIAEYADRIRKLRLVSPVDAVAHDPAGPPTVIYGSYAGDSAIEDDEDFPSQSAGSLDREGRESPDRGKEDGGVRPGGQDDPRVRLSSK